MNNSIKRQRTLSPGVQYLLEYLKRMLAENPSFFYAFEGDNELCGNVFWSDSLSRANYSYFGDTVRVDTSYRTTSRSKIPFITFSGINHHAEPILFGCALLLNESDASFTWLFQTWLRAMSGRTPVSITSDPDRIIQMAVAQVLPEAKNRFCRWSIFRQTEEKLGNVYQVNPSFDFELKKCVNESGTVEEFESCWANLVSRYYLMSNEWLQSLYSIRDQWVPVFLKDVFFGELSLVECNDASSFFFDGFLSSSPTIQSLIKQCEKVASSWQEKLLKDDFETSSTAPLLKTPSPMEKQAANLYTRRIFLKFQGELVETLANPASIVDDSGGVTIYRVAKFGEEHKAHTVRFSTFEMKGTCSCQMFEFCGVPCRHILSVFRAKNVLMLPSEYVLKRWTRNARTGCGESMVESAFGEPSSYQESQIIRHENLRQEALKYVEEGAKSIHVYTVAMDALQEASKRVASLKSKTIEANGGNKEMRSNVNQSSSCLSKVGMFKLSCSIMILSVSFLIMI